MTKQNIAQYHFQNGLFTLALRIIVGWTYFSAFWRRTVLADKLDPDLPGYIGVKFNHFLPNALGIKPMIHYMVTHPDALWFAMVSFTILEGIVGLCLLLGVFTRAASIGVILLALGILLGSGWLGTTCLDEWQIGILGMAAGLVLFFTGSAAYSLDSGLLRIYPGLVSKKWFSWLGSGNFPLSGKSLIRLGVALSVMFVTLTLVTNQYFHGGIWGKLHNKSIKPKLELSEAKLTDSFLSFDIYRVEGVDVYGSFLIGISLISEDGNLVYHLDADELSQLSASQIDNYYIAQIKPGAHSLEIPLGGKARIALPLPENVIANKEVYQLVLTDISGVTWSANMNFKN